MAVINWGVVIDVSDHNSDIFQPLGLWNGVFYWITGRPGYTGGIGDDPAGYTGEAPGAGEDPALRTWQQGILLNELGPMTRMTKNMEITGGYGSLSGASIVLSNVYQTTDLFSEYLENNDIFLINRPMDVYCFLDDVSYHTWGGVVSEIKRHGIRFFINAEDDFKNVHKPIPPAIITETSFPDAEPENIGKVIPVTFGNVLRSKVIPVTGKTEKEVLGIIEPDEINTTVSAATEIDISNDDYRIVLKTPGMDFGASHFAETGANGVYYLRVIRGTEQSVRILDNAATVSPGTDDATTEFTIALMLDDVTVGDFNTNNIYTGDTLSDLLWLFQVLKMDVDYLVSNGTISEYSVNNNNLMDVVRYNKDRREYDNISDLVEAEDLVSSVSIPHPNLQIISNKMDIEGNIKRLIPIIPIEIDFVSHDFIDPSTNTLDANKANLLDRDRTTYADIYTKDSDPGSIRYKVRFPDNDILEGLDKLYLMIDFQVKAYASAPTTTLVQPKWTIKTYGPYLEKFYDSDTGEFAHPGSLRDAAAFINYNYLPNEYYKNYGDDNSEPSYFGSIISSVQLSDYFKIDENVISNFNEIIGARWFQFQLTFDKVGVIRYEIRFKQIGFMGIQNMNVIQDDIYAKIKGETV